MLCCEFDVIFPRIHAGIDCVYLTEVYSRIVVVLACAQTLGIVHLVLGEVSGSPL